MLVVLIGSFILCCKQKRAYDRRIRDWSSDVCSSDLMRRHCDALSIDLPLPTITANGNHLGLAEPRLTPFVLAQAGGGTARGVEDPMPTIVAGGAVSLTQPILVSVTGGEKPKAPRGVDAPLGTITTRHRLGIPRRPGKPSRQRGVWGKSGV